MIAESIYIKPKSVEEACKLARQYSNSFRFVAGGTDLLVNKFQGNEEFDCLIDLTGIDDLKVVSEKKNFLQVGSLVKLDDLKNYPEIKNGFAALLEAADSVASPVIRKTATLGGNVLCENRCVFYNQSEWWREAAGYCLKCEGDVCIATGGKKACFSKFVSDTAIALISMDARVELEDGKKIREIKLEEIYSGNGVEPLVLKKYDIIRSILLPLGLNFKSSYKKLRQRKALDFSSLTTCISISGKGKIKIVLGGVDPAPVVVEGTVDDNENDLIKQAIKKARIVDNDVFLRKYRKEMISVFLKRSFSELSI